MRNTVFSLLVGFIIGAGTMITVSKQEANSAYKGDLISPKDKHKIYYQIALSGDTIWVYDGDRCVGAAIDTSKCPLNDLLAEDDL
jgi:hypothetical protein